MLNNSYIVWNSFSKWQKVIWTYKHFYHAVYNGGWIHWYLQCVLFWYLRVYQRKQVSKLLRVSWSYLQWGADTAWVMTPEAVYCGRCISAVTLYLPCSFLRWCMRFVLFAYSLSLSLSFSLSLSHSLRLSSVISIIVQFLSYSVQLSLSFSLFLSLFLPISVSLSLSSFSFFSVSLCHSLLFLSSSVSLSLFPCISHERVCVCVCEIESVCVCRC